MRPQTHTQRVAAERHRAFHRAIAARAVPERQELPSVAHIVELPAKVVMQVRPRLAPSVVVTKIPESKIARIIRIVAKEYGITTIDILSKRKTKDVVMPRHVAMFLARETTLSSLPEIARRFGRINHTTVMSALWKIGKLRATDAMLSRRISGLKDCLNANEI